MVTSQMVNHDVTCKFRLSFVHFDFILASRWFVPRVDRECAALIDGSTLRKDCVRAVQEEIVLPSSSQRSASVVSAVQMSRGHRKNQHQKHQRLYFLQLVQLEESNCDLQCLALLRCGMHVGAC